MNRGSKEGGWLVSNVFFNVEESSLSRHNLTPPPPVVVCLFGHLLLISICLR